MTGGGSFPIRPQYERGGIAALIPALLAPPSLRPTWLPELARGSEQVAVLVLDGLGWLQLQQRTRLAPTLAGMVGGPITSVAPSTTATALTSLVSGVAPAVHGIVGYRVRIPSSELVVPPEPAPTGASDVLGADQVLNVLRWRLDGGDARPFVPPESFSRSAPFLGQPITVVSREGFTGTGFTVAHQGEAPERFYTLVSGMTVEVERAIRAGEKLVYAYYEGVDKVAHARGFGDHYDAEVRSVDRLVADVIDHLPGEATLVVTADHGQVQIGDNVRVLPPEVTEHCELASGEPRFMWLHAKPGRGHDLLSAARHWAGDDAWVVSGDELLDEGFFGGPLGAGLRPRYGDVAMIARTAVAFEHPDDNLKGTLVCRHGSLTPEEMWVPLLAASGSR